MNKALKPRTQERAPLVKSLILATALMLGLPACAQSSQDSWEYHFEEAHRALDQKNYWQAHRIFSTSLDEAQRQNEDVKLACRLESLAESYAVGNRPRVAEALHKKAIEILSRRLGAGHAIVIQNIDRFCRLIRYTTGTRTAAQAGADEMPLVSHRG